MFFFCLLSLIVFVRVFYFNNAGFTFFNGSYFFNNVPGTLVRKFVN